MTYKDSVLVRLAWYLLKAGKTATGAALAATFNANGIQTNAGDAYVVGGRGIYRYIHSAWGRLTAMGRHADADAVARAFTKANGIYAYS